MIPDTGLEWIVDARGCPAAMLADLDTVRGCCERIVREMQLHVVGQPQWRKFEGPGGVTGLYLLSESHLSVHTFPEFGLMCLNVYCCRPRTTPEWETLLRDELGATAVVVRELNRGLCDGMGDLRSAGVVRSGDPTTTVASGPAGGESS
jgi:S-adenosylmethionine decarboxylase